MSDAVPLKPCRYCAKEIPVGAYLCSGCNRFQNWRRFFNFTSTILSLLVALASVLVVGLPPLLEALQPERAQLTVTFRSNDDDRVSLIVYNTGNVAGALQGFAEVVVPTEYLPIDDVFLDALFKERLPFDRVELKLSLTNRDDALIEAGASRHFELVAEPVEPWRWNVDLTVTVDHRIKVTGGTGTDQLAAIEETVTDLRIPPSVSTSIQELVVTPLDSRIWQDSEDAEPCLLRFASIDVSGTQQDHEVPLSCRRVVDLISLLPSRVSIHGVNLFGVDGVGSDPSTPVSFEHQLVTSGSPPDTIRLNVDLSIDHDIRVKVDEDLDDLFGDTEDLF